MVNDQDWKKDPIASGKVGGLTRAKNMSKKARSESARHAALARHSKKKNKKVIPSPTPVM